MTGKPLLGRDQLKPLERLEMTLNVLRWDVCAEPVAAATDRRGGRAQGTDIRIYLFLGKVPAAHSRDYRVRRGLVMPHYLEGKLAVGVAAPMTPGAAVEQMTATSFAENTDHDHRAGLLTLLNLLDSFYYLL
ncbi:MAG: hypothetical protein Q8Q41_03475 [bacterium]|nr:hypothetical protein [bacterium]